MKDNNLLFSFFNTWLQNYFAESGKSGFAMRLQYFQMRETNTKEFMVTSIALFTIISGVLLGSQGIIAGIKSPYMYIAIVVLFFIQANVLIWSVLISFKNFRLIRGVISYHIGYVESMTNLLLPKIAASIPTEASGLETPLEVINNFWSKYEPDSKKYIKEIEEGEKVISQFEKKQSNLLTSNVLCFIFIILFIVFNYFNQ